MDISTFHTQQIAAPGKTGTGAQALSGSGTGIFAAGAGMSFMDLIFARTTADGAANPAVEATASSLVEKLAQKAELITSQPNYEGHAEPLTPEQILQNLLATDPAALESITSPEEFAALKLELAPEVTVTAPLNLAEARKKIAEILDSLLAGMPQESKPEIIEIEPGKFVAQLQTGKEEGVPALIATGLSVEDLTKLLQDIANGNEDAQSYVIGVVQITPPEAKKEAIFLPRGIVVVQPQHPAGEISTPQQAAGSEQADDLSAQLTALTGGEEGESLPLEESDFEGVLRILERAQAQGSQTGQNHNTGIDKAINAIRQQSPANSAIPGTVPAAGEVSTDFSMQAVYPEGYDFATGSVHQLNVTGPSQFTSLVSHAPQAVYPHPATQMVASIIAKATNDGESKNITIALDPPDLGKVHVRMEMGKDNSVKAHMVIEKPETYLMLQRDAQVLERALQDAGMDTGGGLSFELAQDGSFFERDGNGSGGNSGGGNSDDTGEINAPGETIETRMDWYVDPATGMTRYDALV